MHPSFFDELEKLGGITPEQARASYERLQQLEASQPTTAQALRYGAVGALGAPLASATSDIVRGQMPFKPVEIGGKPIRLGRTRGALGAAAAGAITGGVIPFLRYHMDRAAEMRTLRQFMKEYGEGQNKAAAEKTAISIQKVREVARRTGEAARDWAHSGPRGNSSWGKFPSTRERLRRAGEDVANRGFKNQEKGLLLSSMGKEERARKRLAITTGLTEGFEDKTAAKKKEKEGDAYVSYSPGDFQQSQYSGPMSYGPWILASGLASQDPSLDAPVTRKQAASLMPTTPASPKTGLTAARKVGQPKLTAPTGPTIADISKPQGFGLPLAGAKKGII